jgi:aspartate carbamoyltransferase catalytic subunit
VRIENDSGPLLRPGHLLSIADLGRAGILAVFDRAEELRLQPLRGGIFPGRILGLVFFQPSTRTRVGFHAAMARLGGTAIEVTETKAQPGMSQPESLVDTIRSISGWCDALVLRHHSSEELQAAAEASDAPVINGGSGCEHHPTQALLDLFAIRRRFGRLEDLRIGIAGDLGSSRAARSLVEALAHFSPRELRLMAPLGRELPGSVLAGLDGARIDVRHDLAVEDLDILYMAGLPEGVGDGRLDEVIRGRFRLTRARAEALDPGALVLDPLPRIDEIEPEVDALPAAGYFAQSREALFVRCAVLERVLAAESSGLPRDT